MHAGETILLLDLAVRASVANDVAAWRGDVPLIGEEGVLGGTVSPSRGDDLESRGSGVSEESIRGGLDRVFGFAPGIVTSGGYGQGSCL